MVAFILDIGEVGFPEYEDVRMGHGRHKKEYSRLICGGV